MQRSFIHSSCNTDSQRIEKKVREENKLLEKENKRNVSFT